MNYTLMHQNRVVMDLEIDEVTGTILKSGNVMQAQHLPVGIGQINGNVDRAALNDQVEFVHFEMENDGRVQVYNEKPDDKDFFHNAFCWVPGYQWKDVNGFTEGKIKWYEEIIRSVAHSIMQ